MYRVVGTLVYIQGGTLGVYPAIYHPVYTRLCHPVYTHLCHPVYIRSSCYPVYIRSSCYPVWYTRLCYPVWYTRLCYPVIHRFHTFRNTFWPGLSLFNGHSRPGLTRSGA